MLPRLTSIIPLFDQSGMRNIITVSDRRSVPTTQAFDWPGVMLEAGRNDIAEVHDITPAHHYLSMNVGEYPVTVEMKERGAYRDVTIPPGCGWFNPAGHGFSMRIRDAGPHAYIRVALDPLRFERRVGTDSDAGPAIDLRRSYSIGGRQVHHLLGALVAEAGDGTPSGLALCGVTVTPLVDTRAPSAVQSQLTGSWSDTLGSLSVPPRFAIARARCDARSFH